MCVTKKNKKLIIFINGTLSQFLSAVISGQYESWTLMSIEQNED